jgi:hypothetical protein
VARTSLGTSPCHWPTSAPELVAAIGDERSPKADTREDKDTLYLPPVECVIQASTMDVDLLSQLPLSSATEIAIADPSRRELDAEHAGDPASLSHASRGQYESCDVPLGP